MGSSLGWGMASSRWLKLCSAIYPKAGGLARNVWGRGGLRNVAASSSSPSPSTSTSTATFTSAISRLQIRRHRVTVGPWQLRRERALPEGLESRFQLRDAGPGLALLALLAMQLLAQPRQLRLGLAAVTTLSVQLLLHLIALSLQR